MPQWPKDGYRVRLFGALAFWFAFVSPARADTTALSDYQQNTLPLVGQIAVTIISSFCTGLGTVVTSLNTQLSGPVVAFAGAAMGLWTTFELFKMLSVSHAVSPSEAVDTIVNKLILYAVLAGIVSSQLTTALNSYVVPTFNGILNMGSAMSNQMLGSVGSGGGSCASGTPGASGAFQSVSASASQYICTLNSQLGKGLGVGIYMASNSTSQTFPYFHPVVFIVGVIICLIFIYLMVTTVTICLDALFQFGMTIALLPVVIMSFLFKPTRHVFGVGAKSVITSALALVFTLLAATLSIAAMSPSLNSIYSDANAAAAQQAASAAAGGTLGQVGSSMQTLGSGLGSSGTLIGAAGLAASAVSGLTTADDNANVSLFGPISTVDVGTLLLFSLVCASAMRLGPKLAADFMDFSPAALHGHGAGTAVAAASGAATGGLVGYTMKYAGMVAAARSGSRQTVALLEAGSVAKAGDAIMSGGGGGTASSSSAPTSAGGASMSSSSTLSAPAND